jgi:hypothetical protein
VGLATALVVLALGAALVAAALRPDDTAPSDDPGAAGGAGTPSAPAGAPTDPAGAPTPGPGAAPTAPREVVIALERAIGEAFDTGVVTGQVFDDLSGELDGLRDALAESEPADRDEKLREEARDLREEIDELRAAGALDAATADRLTGLLASLGTG